MKGSFTRELGTALAEELATVVGAMIDGRGEATQGAPLGGAQWIAEVALEGAGSGRCSIAVDSVSATELTSRIMGLDDQVPPEAVIDTFRELCNQALGAVSAKPAARGVTLKLAGVSAALDLEPRTDSVAYVIASDKLPTPLTVTLWGDADAPARPKAVPMELPQTAAAPARSAAGAPAAPPAAAASAGQADRYDVILDIDLPLTVRFGRTELPLKSLSRIVPGSLIDLGRSPDDPVEILVGNRVVARGEVVIVSGNYGIRVRDVISPRDRARSLEG